MNRLFHGDCLDALPKVAKLGLDIELAYLDPPFAVGTTFQAWTKGVARARGATAYDDRWPSFDAYLAWLEARVAAVRDVLALQGTLWLHLDQRAVHEAKVMCDRIFGRARFFGEVIWVPGNGAKAKSGPGLGHQTLLLYGKGKAPVWNARDAALREPYAKTSLSMHFTNVSADGRRYRERIINGTTYRYFADEGRAMGTVWSDCPSMNANTPLRRETTGYPTQKPEKLLDRIVRASSREDAWVLDPFCGSGTTLAAAHAAGRSFVGIDIGELAIRTTRDRLKKSGAPLSYTKLASGPLQNDASP